MRALLIANPQAHNGRAAKLVQPVIEALNEQGITVEARMTEARGHGIDLVREADLSDMDAILAMGGDGTVFETLNGLFRRDEPTGLPLGIIPVGTGNAFVRDFGLDNQQWREAIRIIGQGNRRTVDVGRFTCKHDIWYFLNIIGLGFVSDVCETAHRLKKLGNLSYSIGVLHRTIRLNTIPLDMDMDGQTLKRDAVFIEISNSRYTSNFLMAPEAKLDDGLLDVTILNRVSRTRLITAFPRIFKGTHVELPQVETFQIRQLTIRTEKPRLLTPDGELLGQSPVSIQCLPGALEVFAP